MLSFVNDGHNRHGSQFFITLVDGIDSLDGVHSVFGEVTASVSRPPLVRLTPNTCSLRGC
jgi:cyclophilin family peptidyl-prolyl cis-trans isomerase